MNHTLNQLQVYLKVVQTQSVTKASEALNLSQPAVSIQLKNFQDQFGVPLIEVIGRKLYITDFGKEIAEAAENIINQVYAINYKSLAYKNQLTGRLKIASVSTGKYVMPFFLSGFMRQHAGIELLMDVTNKDKVFESLKNNEIDFGLVSFLPSNLEVENLDLLQDKLYLVGKRETNTGENITAKKMFENLPIIFREPGSGTRQLMEKFLQSNNITVLRKMELTSNEAVKQSLLAGIGYSIMPFIGIRKEIESKDLQIIPVKGLPLKITWNLIWLKGKKLSPTAASFLEYLQLNKQQIVDDTFSWPEL
jgi:DNA-binding transcriptional LysR family regulator